MIIGLDTGERPGKTVAVFGSDAPAWEMHKDGEPQVYASPVEAVERLPEGSTVVLENSTCNFDPAARLAFLCIAENRNLNLWPIDPRHTKNRRYDYGIKKDDAHDAWVLCQIGKEGIIPRARFQSFRKLSAAPLARLRQLRYDLSHEAMDELLPGIADARIRIMTLDPPKAAVLCGAARPLKRGVVWNDVKYHFLTPLLVAYEVRLHGGSLRQLKAAFRKRGIARSNMRYHPLHNKPRMDRKIIMKAQDDLARWMYMNLGS